MAETAVKEEEVNVSREEYALQVVYKYMTGTAAVGLIPFPLVDLIAITGAQLKMLHSLAGVYDLEFKEDRVKSLVASLLTGFGSVGIGLTVARSMFKFVPVIGTAAGVLSMPATSAALTYALGKIFIQHFEAGGTFLDFEPQKVKAYFKELYSEGVKTAEKEQAAAKAEPKADKAEPKKKS
jgi:uncharacterized protein (DUF697 family)